MSEAVLQATIKAYDEFSTLFQKLQQELKKTEQAEKETAQGTNQLNKSVGSFMQTIGQIGALYAFKRALQDVMGTGRDFELTIKQAQAVTGDFSSTLRDLAMASKGGSLDVFGPTQLAQAYRELGQAGATTNEIVAATPDILEFGTAALLDMDQASSAVLATAKSFNIALSDSKQIVDAYTEAMNLGALSGQDFQWMMSSVGAVAKMAGQDFREILSIGSAMRDSGIQAQDAGTSIKSALMALINPTKEAQETMNDIGISVYDASGKMKQWSEITAEFEKGLAPFNEQSRQLALTTVFSSDGIRAMATSLNKGSDYLKNFTDQLENADGATHKMASAMSDTLDGAIRRTNANLERAKILMYEDLSGGAVNALQAINTLITGFNNLDSGSRVLIETLVGVAGLAVAVTTVIQLLRTLGITMAMVTGPIGIVTAALGAITGAVLYYKGRQAELTQELKDSVSENFAQADSIGQLLKRYQELSGKTNLTEQEQADLKKTIGELTDAVPSAITGFDNMGNAITNVGIASEEARKKMAELRQEAIANAKMNADIARGRIGELESQKMKAANKKEIISQYIRVGDYSGAYAKFSTGLNQISGLWKSDEEIASAVSDMAEKARDEFDAANNKLKEAQAAIKLYEDLKSGEYNPKSDSSSDSGSGSRTAGGKTYNVPSGSSSSSSNKAVEAAKDLTDALTATLAPYKSATEEAANAVALLGSKEQYLTQVMENGQGTMYKAIELNKIRTEQLNQIENQQKALHAENIAQISTLQTLQQAYKAAHDPEAAKELRGEIENITQSIAQNSQAWWQLEQQQFAINQKIKQEQQKRWDDAYQQAMDLMNHEVNMARMSTEQQITYLEKLRAAHAWTQQQIMSIEEDLFRLRKQQLTEYLDTLDEEYKSKLESLNDSTKDKIKDIQDQIDALDQEGQASDREEAERKHNEKLADLQKQRQYHELRTGKEHQDALADLDKQIAEENRNWQLQQDEWSREDKKAGLEKEKEQITDNAEKERQVLKDHYNKARDIAEEGILDVIATLAATAPEWFNTGKNLIDQLIAGLESGDFSQVQSEIEKAKEGISSPSEPDVPGSSAKNPLVVLAPNQYMTINGQAAMSARELASYLGVSVGWSNGQVTLGNKSFSPLKNDNGITYVSIRAVAEALNYKVDYDKDNGIKIYKAALGGIFTQPSLVNVREAGQDEAVLPLPMLQPMINQAVEFALKNQKKDYEVIDRAVDRIVSAIETRMNLRVDKLLNIEHFENNDGTDVDLLGRDLGRAVTSITK